MKLTARGASDGARQLIPVFGVLEEREAVTKKAGVGVGIASFLLGATLGGVVTFASVGATFADMASDAMAQWLESEAYSRYRYGSYSVAKAALLKQATFVEAAATKTSPQRTRRLLDAAGLSYARLALAAERAHQSEEHRLYLRKARERYVRGGDALGDDQLRELVVHLDSIWDREVVGE
jgi:hypothetical protein